MTDYDQTQPVYILYRLWELKIEKKFRGRIELRE